MLLSTHAVATHPCCFDLLSNLKLSLKHEDIFQGLVESGEPTRVVRDFYIRIWRS